MVETSTEAIRKAFDAIDKNGNGFIDISEIQQASKELGQEVSELEIKKIFKDVDSNGDGKISFEEFLAWWQHGRNNKLEGLVYFQLKALNLLNKAKLAYTKVGSLLEEKYEEDNQFDTHFINLSVGSIESKTSVKVHVNGGQTQDDYLVQKYQGIEDFDKEKPSVIIRFESPDAEAARQAIEPLFEQLKELAQNLVPDENMGSIIEELEIKYGTNGSTCIIVLQSNNPMIQMILAQVEVVKELYNFNQTQTTIDVDAGCANNFSDFVENPDKCFTDMISEFGAHLSFIKKSNITNTLKKQVQEKMLLEIQKKVDQDQKIRKDTAMTLFTLIKSSKVNIQFRNLQNLKENALGSSLSPFLQVLESDYTLNKILESIKMMNPKDSLENLPMATDLVEFFKTHAKFDFEIIASVKGLSVGASLKTSGFKELVEKILSD